MTAVNAIQIVAKTGAVDKNLRKFDMDYLQNLRSIGGDRRHQWHDR